MTRACLLALAAILALPACGAGTEEPPAAEPEPAPLPDVAEVACREDAAPLVTTPEVRPQRDGVHVEVVNDTGAELVLTFPNQGTGAPVGTSQHVLDTGPGELTVGCSGVDADPGEAPTASFRVVDEDGIWAKATLGCPEQFSSVLDYVQGASGETTDPVEAARRHLQGYGLEPDDVLEPAGYPDAEVRLVRLVRDGEPLAVVQLVDDGTGKWLVGGVNGCSPLED